MSAAVESRVPEFVEAVRALAADDFDVPRHLDAVERELVRAEHSWRKATPVIEVGSGPINNDHGGLRTVGGVGALGREFEPAVILKPFQLQ